MYIHDDVKGRMESKAMGENKPLDLVENGATVYYIYIMSKFSFFLNNYRWKGNNSGLGLVEYRIKVLWKEIGIV